MGSSRGAFLLFLFIILYSSATLTAQDKKFIIYFSDKNSSPYTLTNPSQYLTQKAIDRRQKQNIAIQLSDLPVNSWYLDSLVNKGAIVKYPLKWFNAAVIEADPTEMIAILNLPFVVDSFKVARKDLSTQNNFAVDFSQSIKGDYDPLYGFSFTQLAIMGADEMHRQGYVGEGMTIAVLDAGFKNANVVPYFNKLFSEGRVLGTYDFVAGETSVYEDDAHGTGVLSAMAAYLPGQLIGSSYMANYYLFRTEDNSSELQIEETNWLRAAEYADSIGVDIINSSLGYNTFDEPSMDYTYGDLDGNTTLVTRAADMAASKGILVVNSAGNQGNSSWMYLTAPADGDSVLAVGAVDRFGNYASFSSKGPSSSGKIKPNLAAVGLATYIGHEGGYVYNASGTSFSAPLLCGLAAGFWQANPGLNNFQVIEYLQRSATQYNSPDELLGYGIPHFFVANYLVKNKDYPVKYLLAPNPFDEEGIDLFVYPEQAGSTIDVVVYDVLGREIYSGEKEIVSGRNKLYANASLRPGIYMVMLSDAKQAYYYKMIKK